MQLVEKGLIDIERPVSYYWPEFSQNGKENIPVKYLFCHKSGLCGVSKPLPAGAYCEWDLICNELAKQKPLWEPGTAHGYHAITYGHLIGELLRRVDGRTIGQYFQKEIAEPLNLDFWIGLPDSEFERVSDIYPPKPGPLQFLFPLISKLPRFMIPGRAKFLIDFSDTSKPVGAAFNNPSISSKGLLNSYKLITLIRTLNFCTERDKKIIVFNNKKLDIVNSLNSLSLTKWANKEIETRLKYGPNKLLKVFQFEVENKIEISDDSILGPIKTENGFKYEIQIKLSKNLNYLKFINLFKSFYKIDKSRVRYI